VDLHIGHLIREKPTDREQLLSNAGWYRSEARICTYTGRVPSGARGSVGFKYREEGSYTGASRYAYECEQYYVYSVGPAGSGALPSERW